MPTTTFSNHLPGALRHSNSHRERAAALARDPSPKGVLATRWVTASSLDLGIECDIRSGIVSILRWGGGIGLDISIQRVKVTPQDASGVHATVAALFEVRGRMNFPCMVDGWQLSIASADEMGRMGLYLTKEGVKQL